MKFNLRVKLYDGSIVDWKYDNTDNEIIDHNRNIKNEIPEEQLIQFPVLQQFNSKDKIYKSKQIDRLEIDLGSKCNLNCWYCKHNGSSPSSNVNQIVPFIQKLVHSGISPKSIRFIGSGEPLVYCSVLKLLVPALHSIFPDVKYFITTNGSLLTKEIITFLMKYDFYINISYDGKKSLQNKGFDLLAYPYIVDLIKILLKWNKDKVCFKSVFTTDNCNVLNIWNDLKNTFGDVNFDGLPVKYTDATKEFVNKNGSLLNTADLDNLENSIYLLLTTDYKYNQFNYISKCFNQFCSRILYRINSNTSGYCKSLHYSMNMDLTGDVYPCHCHNVKPNGVLSHLNLTPQSGAVSWSFRKACSICPVLQMCGGYCLMQTNEEHEYTCPGMKAFYTGVFKSVLKTLYNVELLEISYD